MAPASVQESGLEPGREERVSMQEDTQGGGRMSEPKQSETVPQSKDSGENSEPEWGEESRSMQFSVYQ